MKRASIILMAILISMLFITASYAGNDFVLKAGSDSSVLEMDMEIWEEEFEGTLGTGLFLAGEYIRSLGPLEAGVGGEYLPLRSTEAQRAEDFSFINTYYLAGLSWGAFFLRGRLGYSLFIPPESQQDRVGLETEGGIYYAGSAGIQIGIFQLEAMMGVSRARIIEEHFNQSADLTLTRMGLSLGLVF